MARFPSTVRSVAARSLALNCFVGTKGVYLVVGLVRLYVGAPSHQVSPPIQLKTRTSFQASGGHISWRDATARPASAAPISAYGLYNVTDQSLHTNSN
jgi:hypothetical protein